jgi:FixJ family two-component response regulator
MSDIPAVAIIDDDNGFREALAWLLQRWGYRPLACARPEELIASGIDIACILLDLRLVEADGIAAIGQLRRAEIDAPVVMMTAYGDIPVAVEAVQRGAFAFVQKPLDHAALRDLVVRAVVCHREIRSHYGAAAGVVASFGRLTPRERDVFWAMVRGLSIKESAAALAISERTAEVHRSRVLAKMEASSIANLIRASYHVGAAFGGGPVFDQSR